MKNEALKSIAAAHNVTEDQISFILNALSIKTEALNEVQIKGFERVCELMKGGVPLDEAAQTITAEAKAKTTAKNDPEPSQKMNIAEREKQLQQIANRYLVSERIVEILAALRFKPDNLSELQFEQFHKVCEQVQQGMDPAMVAQAVLNEPKAKPAPAPGAVAKTDARSEGETDLVVAAQTAVTAPANPFDESIPGDVRETISQFPREDAQTVVLKSPGIISDAIEVAHETTEQGLTSFVQQEWFDEYRKGVSDPAFGDKVRELLAQGKSRKTSEGSST